MPNLFPPLRMSVCSACGLLALFAIDPATIQAAWPSTVQLGDAGQDVALLQSALAGSSTATGIDGQFGPQTRSAVEAFQTAHGLTADGIVGPQTWKKLGETSARYLIAFDRGDAPANVPATPENESLYECEVTVIRLDGAGLTTLATHRGSVMPSDMDVKGRVKDGWYRLQLGFHKRMGTPAATDLVVKTNGELRPALIVNADAEVPVISNDPNKTTSTAIHVHNGFNTDRFSDGCQTIAPSDWSDFVSRFLTAYPDLSDWHRNNSYRGRELGLLIIR